jgi:poly-gamma-glutamate synthesis protein (capsule biosynthesis protein)
LPYFKRTDILFGNLENMLTDVEGVPKRFESIYLKGSPKAVEGLQNAGFNVLNMANNHAMQHGHEVLKQTERVLQKNGIKTVGVRGNNMAIFEFPFIKLAFLGYCSDQQYEKETHYVEPIDMDRISKDMQECKADGVNYIVVSLHWGNEFLDRPSHEQVRSVKDYRLWSKSYSRPPFPRTSGDRTLQKRYYCL